MLFYQKQSKSENQPRTPLPAPLLTVQQTLSTIYLKKSERVEELKEAQIKNQGTIIELHNQLGMAKDKQVKTLQATVQSEVK